MALSSNGYNPLRWDCEKNGCFNIKRRPKIEVFSDCFPRRINFGDVDGLVELNGNALLLEWKTFKGDLPKGQSIAFKNLTKDGKITVLCVVGNAETMECTHYGFFWNGEWHKYRKASLMEVKSFMTRWAKNAAQA